MESGEQARNVKHAKHIACESSKRDELSSAILIVRCRVFHMSSESLADLSCELLWSIVQGVVSVLHDQLG